MKIPVRPHSRSYGFLARLDGFLICLEVDVAGVPDSNGLYKDTLLLSTFNIADDIEPCSYIYVELLYPLQHMFDIEIRDNGWAGNGVVVLEPQCRSLGDVLIDAAAQSVSAAVMASSPSTSPESGLWCPARIQASHSTTPGSKQRDQTWCWRERAKNVVEITAAAEVHVPGLARRHHTLVHPGPIHDQPGTLQSLPRRRSSNTNLLRNFRTYCPSNLFQIPIKYVLVTHHPRSPAIPLSDRLRITCMGLR
jgi:hypothetical protein